MNDPFHMNCPFCGGADLVMKENRTTVAQRAEFFVKCRSCDAVGPAQDDRETALSVWNLRSVTKRRATLAQEIDG